MEKVPDAERTDATPKAGKLGCQELSGQVIGAAITVHRALGPGFLESIYERALMVELLNRDVPFECQKMVRVFHRDVEVGEHRLDLLVAGILLVELKAVSAWQDIFFAAARSQMRAANISEGLILNFAMIPLGIKRVGPGRNVDM